jgi:molybdopterin-containing oxidoreductase family membrane subunit
LRLRGRGYTDLETYSPAPFAEVDDAVIEKPSRVRLYTLIGGLTGVVTGYAMTIWMANDWPIMIGGKPFSSIPPYTIIGFELTILFGGLLTALGLLVVGGLPRLRTDRAYEPRFSAEDFGLSVRCRERDVSEVDALLRSHGASEVTLVEP